MSINRCNLFCYGSLVSLCVLSLRLSALVQLLHHGICHRAIARRVLRSLASHLHKLLHPSLKTECHLVHLGQDGGLFGLLLVNLLLYTLLLLVKLGHLRLGLIDEDVHVLLLTEELRLPLDHSHLRYFQVSHNFFQGIFLVWGLRSLSQRGLELGGNTCDWSVRLRRLGGGQVAIGF